MSAGKEQRLAKSRMTVRLRPLAQQIDPDACTWQSDALQCLQVLERASELRASPLAVPSASTSTQRCTAGARHEHRILMLNTALQQSCSISASTSPQHKTRRITPDSGLPSRSPSTCPSDGAVTYKIFLRKLPELLLKSGHYDPRLSACAGAEPVDVDC